MRAPADTGASGAGKAGDALATPEVLVPAGPARAVDDEAAALRARRLELDNHDLRAENARLKASILQKQEEIVALGERLGQLAARLDTMHRVAAWMRLNRLNPLRGILRRMG